MIILPGTSFSLPDGMGEDFYTGGYYDAKERNSRTRQSNTGREND